MEKCPISGLGARIHDELKSSSHPDINRGIKPTWVVPKGWKNLPMAEDGTICIPIKIINAIF